MSALTITQLAPLLNAARGSVLHDDEPTWMYVLNYWDSRDGAERERILPDVRHDDVTDVLRVYAVANPRGTVPAQWARIPAVQLNPVPAAPSRLRLRAGDDVLEIDVVAAFELAQSLPHILSQLMAPELKIDRAEQASTCPHCDSVRRFEQNAVREVDIDIRWNVGSFRVDLDDDVVLDIDQADSNHETIAIICEVCNKPVSVPESVERVW